MEWAERSDEDGDKLAAYDEGVREEDLEKIFGIPRYGVEKECTSNGTPYLYIGGS